MYLNPAKNHANVLWERINKFMKRYTLYACIITFIFIIFCKYIFNETTITNPNGWPSNINRSANPFLGKIRIIDSKSNKTLFFYGDDQDFNPITFTETNDGWIVIFKKR
jgi:hypothetical protein